MSSNYMSTVRLVTFLTTLAFSLIVGALSADLIAMTEPYFYYKFSALALAISLLTLLTVGPMFIVDLCLRGSFFSYIIIEVSWLSILWVLWLSSGAYVTWTDQQYIALDPEESNCEFVPFTINRFIQACHERKAIMAFSFLSWILLMFYTVTLLVLAFRAQSKGYTSNVWQTGVRDGTLFHSCEKFVGGTSQAVAPQAVVYQSYPPPAQQPVPMSVPMSVLQTYPVQV